LLFQEQVSSLLLNDADTSIYSFWDAVLNATDPLQKLVRDTPLTVKEWTRQRAIHSDPRNHSPLQLGFATFYLNRCNRSGIIKKAGMIGGRSQAGKWKIDARFNRAQLCERIGRIAMYKDRIRIFNLDAVDFLKSNVAIASVAAKVFIYLDPPYYVKGQQLYLNHYLPSDHKALAEYLKEAPFLWVMTYDSVPQIRRLYAGLRQLPFTLGYSARDRRIGKEVFISRHSVLLPEGWKRIPQEFITSSSLAG
jgi:DNA adenine methylase